MICGEVGHHWAIQAVADRDQIAPHRPVLWAEFNPLGRRLQRGSTSEAGQRVVAQQTHAGHFRARIKAVGNVIGTPDNALLGQRVQGGGAGSSQRRQTTK